MTIGSTISHYRIGEKLGEGGMGVVYKAEDTQLRRTVALKFLSSETVGDDEVKARLIREAQASASLDHPNICAVYGIHEEQGQTFIAMAYIDGPSLADKIKERPLPLDEALGIAVQIGEGLQEAHEKGIVHRDIKPQNVMLTAKGQVKIMDFGLAALAGRSKLTKSGTTLGTPSYMSPEQLEGRQADRRADIWSLGVVLYEMLTQVTPFDADYAQAIAYGILNEDPEPVTAKRSGLSTELDRVIAKALAKMAAERYQHADDLVVDLRRIEASGKETPPNTIESDQSAVLKTAVGQSTPAATATNQTVRAARAWLWPTVAALLAIALAFMARPEPGKTSARFNISLPPGQELTSSPAISADGRIIAYTAQLGADEPQLYLRHLDSFEARLVAGSNGAEQPFFSPDGKWVAFFARGQLQKTEVAGGTPIPLAEVTFPFGGTWCPDDTIIFTASIGSGLLRIPASGGAPESLTRPDEAAAGYHHGFPQVLPGGRTVLFDVQGQTQGGAVLSLDSGQWEIVLPLTIAAPSIFDASTGSPGRLLVSDGAAGIRAAPFDAAHPARTSADVSILTDVYQGDEHRSWLAVSNTGTAVYAPGNPAKSSLVWVDREGTTESLGVNQGPYLGVRLSPDGTKAAVKLGRDLWILNLIRGTRIRLTPAGTTNHLPLWSSDGTRVIFGSNRGGDWDIYSQPADASQPAEALLARPYDQSPSSVMTDGALIFEDVNPQTGFDLWTLSPGGLSQERTASPLRVTPFNERDAEISPGPVRGSRWVAYASDESGRSELYVQSYPGGANRMPISTGGGLAPRWSPDGRELFYITGDAVASVAIRSDGSFGAPRMLFDRANFFFETRKPANYDVSPDGKRFLMVRRDPGSIPRQLNVILNWTDER